LLAEKHLFRWGNRLRHKRDRRPSRLRRLWRCLCGSTHVARVDPRGDRVGGVGDPRGDRVDPRGAAAKYAAPSGAKYAAPSDDSGRPPHRPSHRSPSAATMTPSASGASLASAKTSRTARSAARAERWVPIPPATRMLRFSLAWGLNMGLYVLACLATITYGVLLTAEVFNVITLAWLAGLVVVWLVIEPAEVLGIVLLPQLSENGPIMWCRNKCKELGIYG
jgi:hypothetical protein